jgi:5-methylcytosine-specific restriction endonuclease McrA
MKKVTIDSVTYPSIEAAARAVGMKPITLYSRITQRGWDPARAVTTPVHKTAVYTASGFTGTIKEHAARLGLRVDSIYNRVRPHHLGGTSMPLEEALCTPRIRAALLTPEQRRAADKAQKANKLAELRRKILLIKAHPCMDCHQTFHPDAMEFDHCRGEKSFNIARARNLSWPRIRAEILKCDLVCANCHRIRTHKRRDTLCTY